MTVKTILLSLFALFAAAQLYVRFAPLGDRDWAVDPFVALAPNGNGALKIIDVQFPPDAVFERAILAARETRRTVDLTAPDAAGMSATFVTRSAFWGFPDITTIKVRETESGAQIAYLARARFGSYDHGVNIARINSWVERAGF